MAKPPPLHVHCTHGREHDVRDLLEHGADANQADSDGWTPLFPACQNGHESVARLLLDQADGGGWTSLPVAWLLLERGTAVNQADVACTHGHEPVARLLLERGAAVNQADDDGWAPFHAACQFGHEPVAFGYCCSSRAPPSTRQRTMDARPCTSCARTARGRGNKTSIGEMVSRIPYHNRQCRRDSGGAVVPRCK